VYCFGRAALLLLVEV